MNKDFWERIDRLEELAEKILQNNQQNLVIPEQEYFETCRIFEANTNPSMIKEMIAELRRLEKEADWLATKLVDNRIYFDCEKQFYVKGYNDEANKAVNKAGYSNLWREAARKESENYNA